MSKKIVLALGRNMLDDDLAGQMKAVKITSQTVVDSTAQRHEVIITHGSRSQVGMINQTFEAAAKTEAHSPVLPMSVRVALSQDYISYNLQSALGGELLSCGINKLVATLVTQVEVDASDPAFLNPTKPIGSFFTEQEAELPAKQGYTLREDAGRGYRRIVASPKSVDIIEKKTVKALVDAEQVVITVDGGGIPVIRESNHLCSTNVVIDEDWASAHLAEMIDTDMLIILTAVEKMAINSGKENKQWPDRLSLNDAERFIKEDHFAKGSMLPKMGAAASFARSRASREALTAVLSKAKEGVEDEAGTMVCQ